MCLSKKERERRYEQLRKFMVEEDIHALLTLGNNHVAGSIL